MKKEILTNTPEQAKLRTELCEAYSIEPEEVIFFGDDPKPRFKYEAACVVINTLVPDMQSIIIEQVDPISPDAVAVNCGLKLGNGNMRSAVGIANRGETNDKAEQLTDEQLHQLASSRALYNALRVGGIDLIKLHRGASIEEFSGNSNRDILSRQAHALGNEIGLIAGADKYPWQRILDLRYNVGSTTRLSDVELMDFVAFLKSLANSSLKKAA